jgi:hypothetical protein
MIKSQKIIGSIVDKEEELKNTIQYPTYTYKLEQSPIKNQIP